MAGLKDVAREAGVSVETVSRVLKGKYKGRTDKSRAIMKRVQAVAKELDYRPDISARAMKTKKTSIIGAVFDSSTLIVHPTITEVMKGATEVLDERGYTLSITSLNGIDEKTMNSRIFQERLLDGLFIFDILNEERVREMQKCIPASVLVNTNVFDELCCVRRDEYHTGLIAGENLKALGYKKAVYFDMNIGRMQDKEYHYSYDDRLNGFKDGFGENVEVLQILPAVVTSWLNSNHDKVTNDTVFVAAHNLRLFKLVSALSQFNLAVGRDVGLVSLDDESGFEDSFPELSRISFPRIEIGRIAAEMLIAKIEGNEEMQKSVIVKGQWLAGSTTPKIAEQ